MWDKCVEFLESAKQSRRTVAELIDTLSAPPFKLKQGLIEFWVPTFLFIKRDDFALSEETTTSPTLYVPELSWEVLELMVKAPQKYAVKAFGVAGLRLDLFNSYRHLFNQSTQLRFSNQAFIETVKPLLTFYRTLPDYAKHTKQLTKQALAVRAAIADSKEPEKTFFEDFPMALGYSTDALQTAPGRLETYIDHLQNAIREIRTAYDELLNRFEATILTEYIGETVPFETYKARLQARFGTLKKEMLSPGQKTFVQRLDSQLDDRNAWLNSMAQAVVGRALDSFRDADEPLLSTKFDRLIRDLDNLTVITANEVDTEHEEVFSMKIGSLVDGIREDLVRMPKSKRLKTEQVENAIRAQLSTDYRVNIAALTTIPKDFSANDPRQTRTRHLRGQRQCRVGHLYAAAIPRTRHRVLHLRHGQGVGRNLPTHQKLRGVSGQADKVAASRRKQHTGPVRPFFEYVRRLPALV